MDPVQVGIPTLRKYRGAILEWYGVTMQSPAKVTMAAEDECHRSCVNTALSNVSFNSKVMDKDKYDHIVSFLKGDTSSIPRHSLSKLRWTVKQKKYRLMTFSCLNLKDVLCTPSKKKEEKDTDPTVLGRWRRVVHAGDMYDSVSSVHSGQQGHMGYKKTLYEVNRAFEGIPRSVVQQFVNSCPTCQLSAIQSNTAPLKPILADGFLARMQVDLIDMRHQPDKEFKWICHTMDHWSKFHIMWPMTRKTAQQVANGLKERVFSVIGTPKIFHSDNGREFVNDVIKQTLKVWGNQDVLFINGRPRHSQSQGLVEQGNFSVQRLIANRRTELGLQDQSFPWSEWLPEIQLQLNTMRSEATKQTAYELVFGQPFRSNLFPGAKADEGEILMEETYEREISNTAESEQCQTTSNASEGEQRQTTSNAAEGEQRQATSNASEGEQRRTTSNASEGEQRQTTSNTSESEQCQTTSNASEGEQRQTTSNTSESEQCQTTSNASEGEQCQTISNASEGEQRQTISNASEGEIQTRPSVISMSEMIDLDFMPKKHFAVRAKADVAYRANAEKMKLKYSKKKRVTMCQIKQGDHVTVKIPKLDRGGSDKPRLKCRVRAVHGSNKDLYELESEFGVLERRYRGGDLMPFSGNIAIQDTNTKISLREAARRTAGRTGTQKSCRCKKCGSNCSCKRQQLECTTHCHPDKMCLNRVSSSTVSPQSNDAKQQQNQSKSTGTRTSEKDDKFVNTLHRKSSKRKPNHTDSTAPKKRKEDDIITFVKEIPLEHLQKLLRKLSHVELPRTLSSMAGQYSSCLSTFINDTDHGDWCQEVSDYLVAAKELKGSWPESDNLFTKMNKQFDIAQVAACMICRAFTSANMDVLSQLESIKEIPTFLEDISTDDVVNPGQKMCIGNNTIEAEELESLKDDNWLDDQVVHGYLGILSQQYTWSHEVPVVVLPCAVASHWRRGEYDEWLFEDTKLSESRFVLLPVNMSNSHWFLVVADMNTRELHVLDSMSNEERRKEFFEHWRQFLTERSQHDLDDDLLFNWTLGNLSSNQQVGSNDCGVFVLMNAEALLAGSHIGCLRQYHVPMFRRYALARIIKRARKYDEQVCDLPFCRNEGYSHWVQCERCQAWCHTSCAGIVQEEALDADNVHHVCWICRAV